MSIVKADKTLQLGVTSSTRDRLQSIGQHVFADAAPQDSDHTAEIDEDADLEQMLVAYLSKLHRDSRGQQRHIMASALRLGKFDKRILSLEGRFDAVEEMLREVMEKMSALETSISANTKTDEAAQLNLMQDVLSGFTESFLAGVDGAIGSADDLRQIRKDLEREIALMREQILGHIAAGS